MATVPIPPAGVTALGIPELIPWKPLPPPPVIRADKLDYKDQEFSSLLKDSDPVDAAVLESLWRVRQSGAAVMVQGARFQDIRKIDDKIKVLVENETRLALRRIVNRGDIQIKSISTVTDADFAEVTIVYSNLRSSNLEDRTISIRIRRKTI